MSARGDDAGGGLMLRDQPVIELLLRDLEQLGEGVTRMEVCEAAATRWPDRVIRRLQREGYVIDAQGDRYRLYAAPTGASDDNGTGKPPAVSPAPGAPVDAAPRLFEPGRQVFREAA